MAITLPSRLSGDYECPGGWTFTGDITIPAGTIDNAAVDAGAAIAHTKLYHRFPVTHKQVVGNVTAQTEIVYTAHRGATIAAATAVIDTAPSGGTDDRTVTIDIQKSAAGAAFATILSSTLTIDGNSNEKQPITISLSGTPTLNAGDVLRIVVTIAGGAGTQAQGLLVTVVIIENPS